jgi:hypothetical protein
MNVVKKTGGPHNPTVLARLIDKGKPLVARKIGLMKSADGLERATKPAKPAKVLFQLHSACDSCAFQRDPVVSCMCGLMVQHCCYELAPLDGTMCVEAKANASSAELPPAAIVAGA